jgi:hypothetical protein
MKFIKNRLKGFSKIFIVFFVLMNLSACCFAQEMTVDEKKAFQIRAKEKIDEYKYYLSEIDNKDVSNDVKGDYVHQALNLFIGKGESYSYMDENDSLQIHVPVKTQISSLNRHNSQYVNTKTYLQNLINLSYTKVEIFSADVIRVGNIHKVNGKYIGIAYIQETFCGYRDGLEFYKDITIKKIKIYMDETDIKSPTGRCYLGNTSVVETKRNK